MIVRTRSNSTFTGNTLTITGGTACSITDANNMKTKLGSGWTITSSDGRGIISTTDGKTILATVNADVLQDDTTNGPGAEFGKQKVITDANNMTTKLGSGWTITSSDGRGTISTTDGKTIVATVNADVLQDDTTNGPGAEFGKQKVVFSPATLNDNKNNTSTTIHCQLPKACTINYAPSCS